MYSHYLDALAICRVHGNPSFFITFTCNVSWPEIEEYMQPFTLLTTADRPDVVDRVFERKIHDLVNFLREGKPFGDVEAGKVLYTYANAFYFKLWYIQISNNSYLFYSFVHH